MLLTDSAHTSSPQNRFALTFDSVEDSDGYESGCGLQSVAKYFGVEEKGDEDGNRRKLICQDIV